jgi:hypothetical protein
MLRLLVFLVPLILARPALAAEDLRLLFPLSCTYGKDCWITAYVDDDAEEGSFADYTCGDRTSDAYNGIDIALPDRVAMETGVPVLAAAAGTVSRVHDGADDADPGAEPAEKAANDCGNGVMIDHGDGWQTLYCHLKKSSLMVRQGQKVEAGAEIGMAGQSGAAAFPHLHLSLFRNGRIVDPFTGLQAKDCEQKGAPMWHEGITLPYEPVVIYAAGFKGGAPDIEGLKIDSQSPEILPADSRVLALWAGFYGMKKGDTVAFSIQGPDGKALLSRSVTQQEDKPRQFYFAGYKPDGKLAPGSYSGAVAVKRGMPDGTALTRTLTRTVTVK